MAFVPGMKVRYLPQPEWGIGHLLALADGGAKAAVMFPGREEPTLVSTKGGALVAQQLKPGDAVRAGRAGRPGVITGEVEGGRGLRRYTLRYDDQKKDEEDD